LIIHGCVGQRLSHPFLYDAGENKVLMKRNGMKKSEKRGRRETDRRPETQMDTRGAGYSRPPLARMLRLHERLMENRYPNCRQMAEELEVAAKTVQRDINFMRDQMRLPIEYDKGRFGFHYTRAVISLPAVAMAPVKRPAAPWRRSMPSPIGEKPPLTGAGRGAIPIRIGFDASSSRAARERAWHPTQLIHSLPGGRVEMSFRVRDEMVVACWILSWGASAWVIEPARLRKRVREIASEIVARHRA